MKTKPKSKTAPKPKPRQPLFWIILSEDHEKVVGLEHYHFYRFYTLQAARDAAVAMTSKHGGKFHVMQQLTSFAPAKPPVIELWAKP